jgi:hypothetical protein
MPMKRGRDPRLIDSHLTRSVLIYLKGVHAHDGARGLLVARDVRLPSVSLIRPSCGLFYELKPGFSQLNAVNREQIKLAQ